MLSGKRGGGLIGGFCWPKTPGHNRVRRNGNVSVFIFDSSSSPILAQTAGSREPISNPRLILGTPPVVIHLGHCVYSQRALDRVANRLSPHGAVMPLSSCMARAC